MISLVDLVEMYFKSYVSIVSGVDNAKMKPHGCGSGRYVYRNYGWKMAYEQAFGVGVAIKCKVLAEKVKGYMRAAIGAVHILLTSDEGGVLECCHQFLDDAIEKQLYRLPIQNRLTFLLHASNNDNRILW